MSHICYKIVENLIKKENHIRGLAKELDTNQTTISRKVIELEKKNILDYKEEGRNKVYFLKDTLEKKEFLYILEHEKLLDTLEKYPELRNIIEEFKKIYFKKIGTVILFGSYAKDNPTKKSDIDIYIETMDKKIKKTSELIDSRLNIKIGKFDKNSVLGMEIIKNHIIIKGVERFYELIY
jgi:predicted nucleotidyltransferase